MSSRRQLEKLIHKTGQEIETIKAEIAERSQQVSLKEAYIQGLRDSLKFLPKPGEAVEPPALRPGTDIAVALETLRKSNKPLHLNELLKLMGKEATKKNRLSIGGYMSFYSRKGMFFKKTAPNTFEAVNDQPSGGPEGPPENFGMDN